MSIDHDAAAPATEINDRKKGKNHEKMFYFWNDEYESLNISQYTLLFISIFKSFIQMNSFYGNQ